MDLDRIIKRLQDIDKLKILFLDENQQKVFEMLPKPGIIGKKKPRKQEPKLSIEAIISSKIKKEKTGITDYLFLMNGEKINKKMLDLMDSSFVEELHNTVNMDEGKEKINVDLSKRWNHLIGVEMTENKKSITPTSRNAIGTNEEVRFHYK